MPNFAEKLSLSENCLFLVFSGFFVILGGEEGWCHGLLRVTGLNKNVKHHSLHVVSFSMEVELQSSY